MKFTIYHIANKPINLNDRKAFMNEWRVRSVEILGEAPKKHEIDKWQVINDQLNVLEDELKAKYPTKAEWDLDCAESLIDAVKTFGTVSICIEDNKPVIYLMDIQDEQNNETP
jgi:hypothetical protein